MRILHPSEILSIHGGIDHEEDAVFNGFAFGMATGCIIGTMLSMHYMFKHHPYLSATPGVMENVTKVGAIGGACLGSILGALTGYIIETT